MTNLRTAIRSSRRPALLGLVVLALLATACNPFAPGTPTPQGRTGTGGTAVALTTAR